MEAILGGLDSALDDLVHIGAGALGELSPLARLKRASERCGREFIIGEDVGKIGMHFKTLPPTALVVQRVTPGSWADQNGLAKGDMFLEVDDIPIHEWTQQDFCDRMGSRPIKLFLAVGKHHDAAIRMQSQFRRLFAKRAVAERRKAKEIKSGTRLRCVPPIDDDEQTAYIYPSLNSETVVGKVKAGEKVFASGPATYVGIPDSQYGIFVVPIKPCFAYAESGAVELSYFVVDKAELQPRPSRSGLVGMGHTTLTCAEDVKLGMTLVAPPRQMEVAKLIPDSWAEKVGILVGDTFSEINHIPVFMLTPAEFNVEVKKRPLTLRLVSEAEWYSCLSIQCIVRMKMARSKKTLKALIRRCFSLFDNDKNNFLDSDEMVKILKMLGVQITADEWAVMFKEMCKDLKFGVDLSRGVSRKAFEQLLIDKDRRKFHVSQDQLRTALGMTKLGKRSSVGYQSTTLSGDRPRFPTLDNDMAMAKVASIRGEAQPRPDWPGPWRNVLHSYEMDMSKDGIQGEGTSSICRRGRHIGSGEIVAIKVYKTAKKGDAAELKTMLKKYRRQIDVLQELQQPFDPSKIPAELWSPALEKTKPSRLFMCLADYSKDRNGEPDVVEEDGLPYVITEIAQYSLKEFLVANQKNPDSCFVSKDNVRNITRATLRVMAGLHAKGLVHLDLKPENMMVFDGRLKLIDVDGCVRVGFKIKITDPSISFSPCYCAPEWATFVLQQDGPTIIADPCLDVWSTGCLVCELVTFVPILKRKYGYFVQKCKSHREAGFHFMEWLSRRELTVMPEDVEEFDEDLADLVGKSLLVTDTTERKTCAQCLTHPYVLEEAGEASGDKQDPHDRNDQRMMAGEALTKQLGVRRADGTNRNREDDTSTEKVHAGNLWKLNTGKDPRQPGEWLERDMWIAENGNLCYFSEKENTRKVIVNFSWLKDSEIEPLEGTAKEHALVIKTDARSEDGGQVFVFAAHSAEDLEEWLLQLRNATLDAMPSMGLGSNFVEDMKVLTVLNRRLSIENDSSNYEPIFKSNLRKVKKGGDRMLEEHWFGREVWLARNGSLVYWSHKDHKELVYFTAEDVTKAKVLFIPNDISFYPWTFQVCLFDGQDFIPAAEFSAETEAMRERWQTEFGKFLKKEEKEFQVIETF